MKDSRISLSAAILAALGMLSGVVQAADIAVNATGDGSDINPGDAICEATSGGNDCTLRAAIMNANMDPAFDKISFSGVTEVTLTSALPKVIERVLLDGATGMMGSPRVVINGAGFDCLEFDSDIGADVEQPADGAFPVENSRVENLVVHSCKTAGIKIVGHGYLVRNNIIGLNADQTMAMPNMEEGITISAAADQGAVPAAFPNVTAAPPAAVLDTPASIAAHLKASLPAELAPNGILGNVVAGNRRIGIRLLSQYTTAAVIVDNKVGVAGDGVTPFPNGADGGSDVYGIAITNPSYYNFIHGNIIAGHTASPNSSGIFIDSTIAFPLPNIISGNYIGVSPMDPSIDLGNAKSGIEINRSKVLAGVNSIGLSTIIGPGNKIGYSRGVSNQVELVNTDNGAIAIGGLGDGATNIRIVGNEIGRVTINNAMHDVPNAGHGINIVGRYHMVGGAGELANVISANGAHGIVIRGTTQEYGIAVANNTIQDNAASGVRVWSGGHLVDSNVISGNGKHGVQLSSANAWSVPVWNNSIFDTTDGFYGIDLDNPADGIDPAAAAGQPDGSNSAKGYTNWHQNTAVLSNAVYDAATQMLSVNYGLASAPNGQYRIQLFMNDVAVREGRVFLGEVVANTGAANGDGWGTTAGAFNVAAPLDIPGKYVTVTVTDERVTGDPQPPGATADGPANNTSEFSEPLLVPAGPSAGEIEFVSATYSAMEGAGATATITLRRVNGTEGVVQVSYAATVGGTAVLDDDYIAFDGTASWAAGDAADKSFVIALVDDAAMESNETVNLALSNPTSGATLGAQAAATLTIADDDDPSMMGIKTYTGPSSTGSGNVTMTISGGGNPCGFDLAETSTIGSPPGSAPVPPTLPSDSVTFPHGMLHVRLVNCAAGATINATLTYPSSPSFSGLWHYGSFLGNPAWAQAGGAQTQNVVALALTDGGSLDDDLAANGEIVVDAIGPAASTIAMPELPTVIPASNLQTLIILGLLLGSIGVLSGGWLVASRSR